MVQAIATQTVLRQVASCIQRLYIASIPINPPYLQDTLARYIYIASQLLVECKCQFIHVAISKSMQVHKKLETTVASHHSHRGDISAELVTSDHFGQGGPLLVRYKSVQPDHFSFKISSRFYPDHFFCDSSSYHQAPVPLPQFPWF